MVLNVSNIWFDHAANCQEFHNVFVIERIPDVQVWFDKLRSMRRAAVPDGWEHHELRGLLLFAPTVLYSLSDIMIGLTRHAGLAPQVRRDCHSLLPWRMVGIPKKDDSVRPLSVGSVILRSWLKALLYFMPPLPRGQGGGKSGASVVIAIADWLSHPGDAGTEKNLAKAFDTIDHSVGRHALVAQGAEANVADFLGLCWRGPRYYHIDGISAPIWLSRGAPQGEPTAPRIILSC